MGSKGRLGSRSPIRRGHFLSSTDAHVARLFPAAAVRTLASLVGGAEPAVFQRSDSVMSQGSPWRLALVLDGWLAVRRVSPAGRRFVLAAVGSGELVGPMGPWGAAPGECVGLSGGIAVGWPAPLIDGLVRNDAGFAHDIIEQLDRGIEAMLERLDSVTFEGARARLCRVLLTYSSIAFDRVQPVLTRGDLAMLIGASREMTNRVLRELEASGSVRRLGHHGLALVDESGLRRHLAEGSAVGRRASG
jgi:CRP-like cAMP-binding protein